MIKFTCGRCERYKVNKDLNTGMCYQNPPVPMMMPVVGSSILGQPQSTTMQLVAARPSVNHNEKICAFFKEKEETIAFPQLGQDIDASKN